MLRLLFSFSGRVSRAQYRRTVVLLAAAMVAAFVVLFGSMFVTRQAAPVFLWVLYAATSLAAAIGWIAINVKRAHDLGLSGRAVSPFIVFDLAFREGEPHDNAYGRPPEISSP